MNAVRGMSVRSYMWKCANIDTSILRVDAYSVSIPPVFMRVDDSKLTFLAAKLTWYDCHNSGDFKC